MDARLEFGALHIRLGKTDRLLVGNNRKQVQLSFYDRDSNTEIVLSCDKAWAIEQLRRVLSELEGGE